MEEAKLPGSGISLDSPNGSRDAFGSAEKRKKLFRWREADDIALLRAVQNSGLLGAAYGDVQQRWVDVAREVNKQGRDVTVVACRARFDHLQEVFKHDVLTPPVGNAAAMEEFETKRKLLTDVITHKSRVLGDKKRKRDGETMSSLMSAAAAAAASGGGGLDPFSPRPESLFGSGPALPFLRDGSAPPSVESAVGSLLSFQVQAEQHREAVESFIVRSLGALLERQRPSAGSSFVDPRTRSKAFVEVLAELGPYMCHDCVRLTRNAAAAASSAASTVDGVTVLHAPPSPTRGNDGKVSSPRGERP